MAFSEGINRLQRIIEFVSIDYRSKKEIMAYLRQFNIIISYKTLERDLKQIKEDLVIEVEYKRNLGYRCENQNFMQPYSISIDEKDMVLGYETAQFKIINVFEFSSMIYCNCIDKFTRKVFLLHNK
jgi:arginine repressor